MWIALAKHWTDWVNGSLSPHWDMYFYRSPFHSPAYSACLHTICTEQLSFSRSIRLIRLSSFSVRDFMQKLHQGLSECCILAALREWTEVLLNLIVQMATVAVLPQIMVIAVRNRKWKVLRQIKWRHRNIFRIYTIHNYFVQTYKVCASSRRLSARDFPILGGGGWAGGGRLLSILLFARECFSSTSNCCRKISRNSRGSFFLGKLANHTPLVWRFSMLLFLCVAGLNS